MSCSTTTAPRPGEISTGAVRAISVMAESRSPVSSTLRVGLPESAAAICPAPPGRGGALLGPRRLADDLRIVPPLDRSVDVQQAARRVVRELQPAVLVDHQHPF